MARSETCRAVPLCPVHWASSGASTSPSGFTPHQHRAAGPARKAAEKGSSGQACTREHNNFRGPRATVTVTGRCAQADPAVQRARYRSNTSYATQSCHACDLRCDPPARSLGSPACTHGPGRVPRRVVCARTYTMYVRVAGLTRQPESQSHRVAASELAKAEPSSPSQSKPNAL